MAHIDVQWKCNDCETPNRTLVEMDVRTLYDVRLRCEFCGRPCRLLDVHYELHHAAHNPGPGEEPETKDPVD